MEPLDEGKRFLRRLKRAVSKTNLKPRTKPAWSVRDDDESHEARNVARKRTGSYPRGKTTIGSSVANVARTAGLRLSDKQLTGLRRSNNLYRDRVGSPKSDTPIYRRGRTSGKPSDSITKVPYAAKEAPRPAAKPSPKPSPLARSAGERRPSDLAPRRTTPERSYADLARGAGSRRPSGLSPRRVSENMSVNEQIKGWKHAGRDISKFRAEKSREGHEAKLVPLKKDGTERGGFHDPRWHVFKTEEEARRRHAYVRSVNPNSNIRHNLYVNGKLVGTLSEARDETIPFKFGINPIDAIKAIWPPKQKEKPVKKLREFIDQALAEGFFKKYAKAVAGKRKKVTLRDKRIGGTPIHKIMNVPSDGDWMHRIAPRPVTYRPGFTEGVELSEGEDLHCSNCGENLGKASQQGKTYGCGQCGHKGKNHAWDYYNRGPGRPNQTWTIKGPKRRTTRESVELDEAHTPDQLRDRAGYHDKMMKKHRRADKKERTTKIGNRRFYDEWGQNDPKHRKKERRHAQAADAARKLLARQHQNEEAEIDEAVFGSDRYKGIEFEIYEGIRAAAAERVAWQSDSLGMGNNTSPARRAHQSARHSAPKTKDEMNWRKKHVHGNLDRHDASELHDLLPGRVKVPRHKMTDKEYLKKLVKKHAHESAGLGEGRLPTTWLGALKRHVRNNPKDVNVDILKKPVPKSWKGSDVVNKRFKAKKK